MRIRIKEDWWDHYVLRQPGRTMAEKEIRAEEVAWGPANGWVKGMNRARGKWVEVETAFLFGNQFNIGEPNLRVMCGDIDAIDFGPEFADFTTYRKAVEARYAIDWPGTKDPCRELANRIRLGQIEDVTKQPGTTEP